MLEAIMKKMFIFLFFTIYFSSCTKTDDYGPSYEPLYLNETDVDVLFLFKDMESYSQNSGEVLIHPMDTIYCLPGGRFPLLQKSGLRWSGKLPFYDIKLIFNPDTDSSKCLYFEGDPIKENDIRSFSSYENIGNCDFCVIRTESIPYGMLYRITDDMLQEVVPCD